MSNKRELCGWCSCYKGWRPDGELIPAQGGNPHHRFQHTQARQRVNHCWDPGPRWENRLAEATDLGSRIISSGVTNLCLESQWWDISEAQGAWVRAEGVGSQGKVQPLEQTEYTSPWSSKVDSAHKLMKVNRRSALQS